MDVPNQSMMDAPARSLSAFGAGVIILIALLVITEIVKRMSKRDELRRLAILEENIALHTSFVCSDETSESVQRDSWTKLQDAYLEYSNECQRQCDKLRKRRRNCDSDEVAEINSKIEVIQAKEREMLKRKCRMAA